MGNAIVLEGRHGTTQSRSASIQATGFKPELGRRGTGAYLWSNSHYAEYLAKSWWRFKLEKKLYENDTNKKCSVILARLQIQEEEFIDLDEKFLKDEIALLCLEKDLNADTKDEEISGLYDMFLSRIEKKLGSEFKVHESAVATPSRKHFFNYPERILGPPRCYIVRDISCIKQLTLTSYSDE